MNRHRKHRHRQADLFSRFGDLPQAIISGVLAIGSIVVFGWGAWFLMLMLGAASVIKFWNYFKKRKK